MEVYFGWLCDWELMVDALTGAVLESAPMQQIVDQIGGLYDVYPAWLVTTCLAIVGLGLGWGLWKLIRFGLVVMVTLLLLTIVVFVGWMILGG